MSERLQRSQRKRLKYSMLRLADLRPDLFTRQHAPRASWRVRARQIAAKWWGIVLLLLCFAVAIYGNCVAGP